MRYLHHLVELEVHERRRRRIASNVKDSELPPDKTLATLERALKVAKTLPALCEGAFVERGDNLPAFGLPGRGKTHLVCAIGHELIRRGHRVLFTVMTTSKRSRIASFCSRRRSRLIAVSSDTSSSIPMSATSRSARAVE